MVLQAQILVSPIGPGDPLAAQTVQALKNCGGATALQYCAGGSSIAWATSALAKLNTTSTAMTFRKNEFLIGFTSSIEMDVRP
jgi:hypothetical protein